LSGPEQLAALAGAAPIPRDGDAPVFPAPWAARAFALAVALNERGLFTWNEWAEMLGAELRRAEQQGSAEPEDYWRAWLSSLERMLAGKQLAGSADLADLREAWRRAAKATPHGQEIRLQDPR
jgi:nitrile hydratase accessory protein